MLPTPKQHTCNQHTRNQAVLQRSDMSQRKIGRGAEILRSDLLSAEGVVRPKVERKKKKERKMKANLGNTEFIPPP